MNSSQSTQDGGEGDAEGAYLRELAQQAKGDGTRSTAHLQDEGAILGSLHMGHLGHLLQYPFNQLLQSKGVWIRVSANLAPGQRDQT